MDHDRIAEGLFFVVGTGRCGSTVLRSVLAAHPRLVVPPETQFFLGLDPDLFGDTPMKSSAAFDAYLDKCRREPYWALLDVDETRLRRDALAGGGTARATFLSLLAQWVERSGKSRVGEKSPGHMAVLPRLQSLFPKARFIHIFRDPRAVVASMMLEPWTHDNIWRHAKLWRRTMALDARYARQFGPAYERLRYEDFVRDPETQTRRLCAFLGEAYDPVMLRPPADSTGPPHTDSLERWRDRLTPRQVSIVERVTRPWITRLGYRPVAETRPQWLIQDTIDLAGHWVTKQAGSVRKRLSPLDRG